MPSRLGGRSRALLFTMAVMSLGLAATGASVAVDRGTGDESRTVVFGTSVKVSPGLAFQMPSTEVLRASPRKVFAHYLPSLPVSLDNEPSTSDYYARNYLQPDGEGGQHKAYGGFLRDRPMPRPPRSDPEWQVADLRDEVRQAVAAGIDGFSVDLLQMPGGDDPRVSEAVTMLLDAAHQADPGFEIMLMPDMSGSLSSVSASDLADYVADLGRQPSAYKLADGRLVVAPFHAESHDAAWWQDFVNLMRTQHGIGVALLPVFLDERGLVDDFSSFSYGISNWGARNPVENDPASLLPPEPQPRAEAVHKRGLVWMQPVSLQDERPRSGTYQEANATQNLRNTWTTAIDEHAEIVQLVTWNDYAEGTQFAPSLRNNWAPLDISAYYLAWFKTGVKPVLRRDVVYLTHRTQPFDAHPQFPETLLMHVDGETRPVNRVEALAMLPEPATVRLEVGGRRTTCELPAGVSVCTAALQPGTVSAEIERDDLVTAKVVSPYPVTLHPAVQDLSYISASSTGSRVRVPAPAG